MTESLDNALYPWTGHPASTSQVTYTADGLNRITQTNANTFSYDANGNLISDSLTTYVYDVETRLVSASGQNTAALRYDPFGRLHEVTDGQGNIRRFLYDGDALVGEYGPTGTMLARHVHGVGVGDDPLITYPGASVSYLDAEYLYTDRLGSVIARYRRDGSATAINGYDEYGVPGPSTGLNNNGRFRYTGQVWLPELGLYYYKARMYSPTIGRFMQTDPIGYADGMNMYAYVGNDPVNGVDPTGLEIVVQGHKSCPSGWTCYSGEGLREYLRGMQLEVVDRAVFDQYEFFSVDILVEAEEPESDVCNSGTRLNFSVGLGGTALLGVPTGFNSWLGGGASVIGEVGISLPISSLRSSSLRGAQGYWSGSGTVLSGIGAFAGGGESFGVSFSEGPMPYRDISDAYSRSQVLQGGAAWGGGAEGSIVLQGDTGGGVSGGPRAGAGAYYGIGERHSVTFAPTPLGC